MLGVRVWLDLSLSRNDAYFRIAPDIEPIQSD